MTGELCGIGRWGNGEKAMSSMFLVVYTTAHLIGAVSHPLTDQTCATAQDVWLERMSFRDNAREYVFACEVHRTRPKVQTRIDPDDRAQFESDCFNLHQGLPKCAVLPNGDISIVGMLHSNGKREITVIKFKDRLNGQP
ncbi:hypothetical protein [Bradyrhizobium sp. LMG 9283]|uniref:hypothetical protein n=1 Tax=Bradyrhizobium sp. LMG 9283 TaxID=592064 RepID=UPI00388FC505